MMQTRGLTDGFVLTGIIASTYGQVSVNATRCRFSDVFPLILEAVDELGVRVVALDSLGMALEGDALKGR
jgi:hypothetical protein